MAYYINYDWIDNQLGISDEDICFSEMIDEAPTINIVKCSECKWYYPNNGTNYRCDRPTGRFPEIAMSKNGFCSFGKEKEDRNG